MSEDNTSEERARILLMLGEARAPNEMLADSSLRNVNSEESDDVDYIAEESESDSSDSDLEDEVMERFQSEIEDAVDGFTDEVPVSQNCYPESDSDNEDFLVVNRNREERMIKRRGNGNLYHGQVFPSGVAFKEAVLDHALKGGWNIKQYRWDVTNLAYKCAISPCAWRVYCSINKRKNRWEIKREDLSHSCTRNGHCEMLTDPVIARLFVDKIREELDYFMPKKIQQMIKEQWKLVATRNQCQEARNKALKWIAKESEDQFAHIRGYCKEITESNPNSTVVLETTPGAVGEEDLFDRFMYALTS